MTPAEMKAEADKLLGKKPKAITKKQLTELLTIASGAGRSTPDKIKAAKDRLKELLKAGEIHDTGESYAVGPAPERAPVAAPEPEAPKAPEAPAPKPKSLKGVKPADVTEDNIQEILDRANKGEDSAKRILFGLQDMGDAAPVKVAQSGGQWGKATAAPAPAAAPEPTPAAAPKPKGPQAKKGDGKTPKAKAPEKLAKVEPRVPDAPAAKTPAGPATIGAKAAEEFRQRAVALGVNPTAILSKSTQGLKRLEDLPDSPEAKQYMDNWLKQEAAKPEAKQAVRMRATLAKGDLAREPKQAAKSGFTKAEIREGGISAEDMKRRRFTPFTGKTSKFLEPFRGKIAMTAVEKKNFDMVSNAYSALQKMEGGYPQTPIAMELKSVMEDTSLSPEQKFRRVSNMYPKVFIKGRLRGGVIDIAKTKEAVKAGIKAKADEALGQTMGAKYANNDKALRMGSRKMFKALREVSSATKVREIQQLIREQGIDKDFRNARTMQQTFALLQEGDVAKLREYFKNRKTELKGEVQAKNVPGKGAAAAAEPALETAEEAATTAARTATPAARTAEPELPRLEGEPAGGVRPDRGPLPRANVAGAKEYPMTPEPGGAVRRTPVEPEKAIVLRDPARIAGMGPREPLPRAGVRGERTSTNYALARSTVPRPIEAGKELAVRPRGGALALRPPVNQPGSALPNIAGQTGKLAGLMRFLGPLAAVYGAYELASGLHGATIGAEDEKRLRVLEALGSVTGGIRQDQQMQTAVAQQRAAVELAGIQRQQELDAMRNQYTQNQALNSLVRGNEQLLAAIAQPSRPTMAELMAGLR
jgi:hypothetical protein